MTEIAIKGRVGPDVLNDGAEAKVRLGRGAEQVFSELHGRYFESNFRGNVFSGGMGLTAISNATFTVGGIGATTTPVCGVWNPVGSGVNLSIIEASLALTLTALAVTGPGGFVWATSVGNGAISTGNQPFNRSTLQAAGSSAKDMTAVAVTGITNPLVVRFGSALLGGSAENVSFTATAVAMQTAMMGAKEIFDGSLIVPPGGVLALLAATTPVAHSAVSALVWEEIPL